MHAQQQPPNLPEGGTEGQVLTKTGPGEEDTAWHAPEVTAEALAGAIEDFRGEVTELQKEIGPGGYRVELDALAPGDLLQFNAESAWSNIKPHVLTDGGNF